MGWFREPTVVRILRFVDFGNLISSKFPDVLTVSHEGSTISHQSSVSSVISRQASSLQNAITVHIKSGCKAIAKPFKKAHCTLPPCSEMPTDFGDSNAIASDDDIPDLEGDGGDSSDNLEKRFGTWHLALFQPLLMHCTSETQVFMAFICLLLFQV